MQIILQIRGFEFALLQSASDWLMHLDRDIYQSKAS